MTRDGVGDTRPDLLTPHSFYSIALRYDLLIVIIHIALCFQLPKPPLPKVGGSMRAPCASVPATSAPETYNEQEQGRSEAAYDTANDWSIWAGGL